MAKTFAATTQKMTKMAIASKVGVKADMVRLYESDTRSDDWHDVRGVVMVMNNEIKFSVEVLVIKTNKVSLANLFVETANGMERFGH